MAYLDDNGNPVSKPAGKVYLDGSGAPKANESHPLDSILHGAKDLWEQVNPVAKAQGIHEAVNSPLKTINAMGAKNEAMARAAKKAYDEGDYPSAIRHAINYLVPFGSGIEDQSDKFAKGDIAGGVGGSLGLGLDAALTPKIPGAVKATGAAIKRAAVPFAESALGIGKMDRAFGKTPGVAVLEETTGLRPATVAESAKAARTRLGQELEAKATASQRTMSLEPARKVLTDRSAISAGGNSAETPADLAKMSDQLTLPRPGFAGATSYPAGAASPITLQPGAGPQFPPRAIPGGPPPPLEISPDQSAMQGLRMKREFANDHTKWNPLHPNREMETARQAYRELDGEFDKAVPDGRDLNQRISSLYPVIENAEKKALEAGPTQGLLARAAAHTGALAGAGGIGYAAGGGPGAVAAVLAQQGLAHPATRMAVARALYKTGKGVGKVGRAAQGASAAGTVLRRQEDDPLGLFQ